MHSHPQKKQSTPSKNDQIRQLQEACESSSKLAKRMLFIGNFNRFEDLERTGGYSSIGYSGPHYMATPYSLKSQSSVKAKNGKYKKQYGCGARRFVFDSLEQLKVNAFIGLTSHASNCATHSAVFLFYLAQDKHTPDGTVVGEIFLAHPFDHVAAFVRFDNHVIIKDNWLGYHETFYGKSDDEIAQEFATKTFEDTLELQGHLIQAYNDCMNRGVFDASKVPQYLIDYLYHEEGKVLDLQHDYGYTESLLVSEINKFTARVNEQDKILNTPGLLKSYAYMEEFGFDQYDKKRLVQSVQSKVEDHFSKMRDPEWLRFEKVIDSIALGKDIEPLLGQVDATEKDYEGRGLVWYAAALGNVKALEILKNQSLRFDLKDNQGITPLIAAIIEEEYEAARFILDNTRFEAFQVDRVFDACPKNISYKKLDEFIKWNASNRDFQNYLEEKAFNNIWRASQLCSDIKWRTIFSHSMNAKSVDGNNLLQQAVLTGDYFNVTAIYDFCPNILERNKLGINAIELALASDNLDSAYFLISKVLLSNNPFAKDIVKKPLQDFCTLQQKTAIKLILRYDPYLDCYNNTSLPLCHGLVKYATDEELVALKQEPALLQITVEPWLTVSFNDTLPVFEAIKNNNYTFVEMCLESFPYSLLEREDSISALQLAVACGNYALIEMLLDKLPADELNYKNSHGNTALHIAAAIGDSRVCQLLIGHSANTTLANSHGKTAINVAEDTGESEIIELLSKKYAPRKPKSIHSLQSKVVDLPYWIQLAEFLDEGMLAYKNRCMLSKNIALSLLKNFIVKNKLNSAAHLAHALRQINFADEAFIVELETYGNKALLNFTRDIINELGHKLELTHDEHQEALKQDSSRISGLLFN